MDAPQLAARGCAAAVSLNDANFHGKSKFNGAKFNVADFRGAKFYLLANFIDVEFKEQNLFYNTLFKGGANFAKTHFLGHSSFFGSKFYNSADFCSSEFPQWCYFNHSVFDGDTKFENVKFRNVDFISAKLVGNISFSNSKFNGYCNFSAVQFEGGIISFRDAEFSSLRCQEFLNKIAKQSLESRNDFEEADSYFFEEMVAKRKQKVRIIRILERVILQEIFGYGTRPERLFFWYMVFISFFALIYKSGPGIQRIDHSPVNSTIEYLFFSISTAMTPGSASYITLPQYQYASIIESVIGMFMWAAFIALFTRKFLRNR